MKQDPKYRYYPIQVLLSLQQPYNNYLLHSRLTRVIESVLHLRAARSTDRQEYNSAETVFTDAPPGRPEAPILHSILNATFHGNRHSELKLESPYLTYAYDAHSRETSSLLNVSASGPLMKLRDEARRMSCRCVIGRPVKEDNRMDSVQEPEVVLEPEVERLGNTVLHQRTCAFSTCVRIAAMSRSMNVCISRVSPSVSAAWRSASARLRASFHGCARASSNLIGWNTASTSLHALPFSRSIK